MSNIALLIVFNHNYEKNINKLEQIYGKRFQNIWHIIPFYQGDRKNVINVFGNSYYFQGFIATALDKLKTYNYDYYIIIADDLYLNPKINEDNFKKFFNVNEYTAFIPRPFLLTDANETRPSRPYPPIWNPLKRIKKFKLTHEGIEITHILPNYKKAKEILNYHGFHFKSKLRRNLFISFKPHLNSFKDFLLWIKVNLSNFKHFIFPGYLRYPLIGSYSDITIVSRQHLNPLIQYCSSFAALNLFVEAALPTSIALAFPKLVTEKDLNFQGQTYWYYDKHILEEKYSLSLSILENNFPENTLYIHPVKLSKWK